MLNQNKGSFFGDGRCRCRCRDRACPVSTTTTTKSKTNPPRLLRKLHFSLDCVTEIIALPRLHTLPTFAPPIDIIMNYTDATAEVIDIIMKEAWEAFMVYRKYSLKQRAAFMRAVAK